MQISKNSCGLTSNGNKQKVGNHGESIQRYVCQILTTSIFSAIDRNLSTFTVNFIMFTINVTIDKNLATFTVHFIMFTINVTYPEKFQFLVIYIVNT